MDVLQTLLDNQNLFSTFSNMVISFFRIIGWWIIRGLASLNKGLEDALNILFENLNFFGTPEVGFGEDGGGLYRSLMPLFWALLTVGLIIVGFLLMTNRLKNKVNIPTNLVLTIVLVLAMPTILNTLSAITQAAVGAFGSETSYMDTLVRDNVTDLAYLDQNNFSPSSIENKNNFPDNGRVPVWAIIDAAETMDYNECNNKDVFRNQLVVDSNGNYSLEENANKNFLGIEFLDKLYYRYQINWTVLLVSNLMYLVALLFMGIKTGRYIFDIAFSGIFLMLVSPLDISSGQRTKKIIDEIINLFAAIIMTVLLLRIYGMAMSFSSHLPWLPALILQIAFSIALVGGPNIVQKILGVDIGVGNELQTMASGAYLASALGRAVKGGIGAIGSVAKTAGKAGAGIGVMGAAAAGAVSSGVKNAAEHSKDKAPKSTPGDFTVLKDEPNTGNHDAIGSGSTPARIGDGSQLDNPDASGSGSAPDSPLDPSGGDSSAELETIDAGLDAGNSGVMSDSSADAAPESKRVTRDDTIGGALSKMVGNTRPVQAAKAYKEKLSDAYRIGQNTMDKSWSNYRSQEPPIQHVHAEPVEFSSSSTNRPKQNQETIIIEDEAKTQKRTGLPSNQKKIGDNKNK